MNDDSPDATFSQVSASQTAPPDAVTIASPLRASRAYSLALSPQLIYARSTLLQFLVSSKVYRQLEFLAVGSWWVYSPASHASGSTGAEESPRPAQLLKVPNGREDVFQDQVLDFKAKRALMKFLRFISEYEEEPEIWQPHRNKAFHSFLSEQFKVPTTLHSPLLALTLSVASPEDTTTEFALPRIARHLRSIGVFGAGFGAVIPKWGGMSEITQVACRASAVGGGVYVLGKGLDTSFMPTGDAHNTASDVKLRLKDGEIVTAKCVVTEGSGHQSRDLACSRSITIVSSSLDTLFPPIAEEAPAPAAAVVVFPVGSVSLLKDSNDARNTAPIHIFVHSSDTGECPPGQSILYASTSTVGEPGLASLKSAVDALLAIVDVTPSPVILWTCQYVQQSGGMSQPSSSDQILTFPPAPMDLAFDDSILDQVNEIWSKIMGADAGEFMVFEDREANLDED
ncbi:FAD/NAD(P)-binding domain-containing protein [Aaosphaeria arxii CBS 175.79]|uniref:FAD/NAD(P)-binding domain-containing protein n=1 Tax=Aaosphaeria arxii CBS 175.79 TaxID=1450172 RepID=A0A6A5XVU9_9PLEO|nr:FAD/NAD(P)-binding domain-containing protein [Aaosphaeria arxii CBS 175.79]KAF2017445.1 FAD/NAD(P)-binding domain-containing protein [Aaosphaeria arxii CBS 175.79]